MFDRHVGEERCNVKCCNCVNFLFCQWFDFIFSSRHFAWIWRFSLWISVRIKCSYYKWLIMYIEPPLEAENFEHLCAQRKAQSFVVIRRDRPNVEFASSNRTQPSPSGPLWSMARMLCFAACLFLVMPACNVITELTNADGTRNTAVKRPS